MRFKKYLTENRLLNLSQEEVEDIFDSDLMKRFEIYSSKWLRSGDYESKEIAYDLVIDNPKLHSALLIYHFGKLPKDNITLYRVGGSSGITSFFTNKEAAQAYQKRFDVSNIKTYAASPENIVPLGNSEVWCDISYIKEEYFAMTADDYTIFKNPSQKEIIEIWKIQKAMRALVDFDNKIWFLFDSDLYHQAAAKKIAKEYEGKKSVFSCFEIYLHKDKIRVRLADDNYKIVPGAALYFNTNKEPNRQQIEWFKNKFKFLGEINEEYFGRGDARKKSFEVFKNPSKKEYREAIEASLDHGTKGFIRLLIDIKTKDVYIASGKALHDEIAEVIDNENGTDTADDYESYYYPLVGHLDDGTLELTNSTAVSFTYGEQKDIINTMEKKTYYDVIYRER